MDIKNINFKGIIKGIIDTVVLFFREVKVEIKKISWPQRNETIASTSIVIIIVLDYRHIPGDCGCRPCTPC